MSSSYCFIRMPTGEALRVPVSGSMTVAEVKQRIIEMRPSFSPDSIRLIHAGAEMADRTPLHSYNLVAETTLHLVRSASRSPIKPSPASPAPATVPQRPRYQPLPRVDHSLPELPDYASALVFLWCTAAEHRPLASDAYGEPLPQQVQRGSIRPLCATCKNQCVEVDATSISWSQVFASSLQGQCLACDASCSIEWTFVCQGELALPTPDQRNICKAASLHMANHALPNLIFNTPARPEDAIRSIDTDEPDPVQIVFHPCGHRLSATGLGNYVRSNFRTPRTGLVENTHLPSVLGRYAVRCTMRDCSGVIHLPTCKLAGDFDAKLKAWAEVERCLSEGGCLCVLPHHQGLPAFMPAPDEFGPRIRCPTCNDDMCEEHSLPWRSCEHSLGPFDRTRQRILDALAEGARVRCPSCQSAYLLNGGCTHMNCTICMASFCYFCGRSEQDADKGDPVPDEPPIYAHNTDWAVNPLRCPWFFHQHPMTSGRPVEALAKFHRHRTLRLLRELRDRISHEEFDHVFMTLSERERSIEMEIDGDKVTMPPLTIPQILRPVPVVPYVLP